MPARHAVIGLEVHARLLTGTKLFCGCPVRFGAEPNSLVCPICLGYPGALPVLNRQAVTLGVRAALATGCRVVPRSRFARKNYFYPDLPKGYQITQHDRPFATGGTLEIGDGRAIRIRRIHLEEDAGKLIHDAAAGTSLVDLNRAGTPLIEIVSEPDLRSADEAVAYATALRGILVHTGVCDGNMEEGSLRIDLNVSVANDDGSPGTRAEVKNLNSFRFLARAIEFELDRQREVLDSGGRVVQETRLFDPKSGTTRAMRSKEEEHDYRYFPEPDLGDLEIGEEWLGAIAADLPELPATRTARWESAWDIPRDDAVVLAAEPGIAAYFEAVVARGVRPRLAANWIRNEVLAVPTARRLPPELLARLLVLLESGTISGKAAKQVFEALVDDPRDPESIVAERGLAQLNDPEEIRRLATEVLRTSTAQLEQYRAGKTRLFGYFVGQVLAASGGRANPELVNAIVETLLAEQS